MIEPEEFVSEANLDDREVIDEGNSEQMTSSEGASDLDLVQFFREFFKAKGTKSIVFITLFLSMGIGCVVGVVGNKFLINLVTKGVRVVNVSCLIYSPLCYYIFYSMNGRHPKKLRIAMRG